MRAKKQGKAEPTGRRRHMLVLQTARSAQHRGASGERQTSPERKGGKSDAARLGLQGGALGGDRPALSALLLAAVSSLSACHRADPARSMLPEAIGGAYDADCGSSQPEVPVRNSPADLRYQKGRIAARQVPPSGAENVRRGRCLFRFPESSGTGRAGSRPASAFSARLLPDFRTSIPHRLRFCRRRAESPRTSPARQSYSGGTGT